MQQNPSKSKGPDKPVEQVDWYHAVLFCNMRSLKEGLKPCYDSKTLACDFTAHGYRLPTEAEWEYACRAGARGSYSFGSDAAKLKACAWFKANAGQTSHPVGQKAQMHGAFMTCTATSPSGAMIFTARPFTRRAQARILVDRPAAINVCCAAAVGAPARTGAALPPEMVKRFVLPTRVSGLTPSALGVSKARNSSG
jgi:hypothetical protein